VYYFDLLKAVKQAKTGDTPWTPAITLMLALRCALDMMREEGIENIVARHDLNARGCRAAVRAMGLDLVAATPSNATTAVWTPGDSSGKITKHIETRYGCKIAGGQGALKGKIVRIGHLGAYFPEDMYQVVSAFEATLNDLGLAKNFGAGIEALRGVYAGAAPAPASAGGKR
jgi:aspartate aminotransferase-like enzyme